MANQFKQMQLKAMDAYLSSIRVCDRPSDGWIAAIRKSLGMSVRQLAQRIGITQQSVFELEAREIDESISIKSLRKAAEAMDCKVVYALIPRKGGLQDIVFSQALKKAEELVKPVNHTMMLEAQAVGNLQDKIKQTAEELAKQPDMKLWD